MDINRKAVAIIGSSFRFPIVNANSFTDALLTQQDLITQTDPTRWLAENFLHPDKKFPGTSYTFSAGSLGDIGGFDASFFGLSPREVVHMDPQQRYLLEMTWEAMESAGYPPSTLRGTKCAVYMGVASIDYGLRYLEDLGAFDQNTGTGTTASIAANRISYLYDLKGPSLVIDTACSSSMVAFHHACESIRRGEVSLALAGGISLHVHPYGFIAFSKASMLSRQGRCRVFDASADGYVRSEGGGVLLLKDYDLAVQDGDNILAVVAGTAANADGYKSALTIPNASAQIVLMKEAYAAAGISPDEITYLEAHGTGTPVGDPIEATAIGKALGQARQKPLPIGSVKSNVGHLETASGMAGLAKALVCIQYREIPATIGIKELNPSIPFDDLNLQVVTENQPLPQDKPIIVGINSFGFGGSNAHVILRSVPNPSVRTQSIAERVTQPIPLWITARSEKALKERVKQIRQELIESPEKLYDIAWTLRFKRDLHALGIWLEGSDAQQLATQLDQFVDGLDVESLYPTRYLGVQAVGPVFVYSGNGCQWADMGKALLEESDEFKAKLEEVDRYYQPLSGCSLIELIAHATTETYEKTEWAQPALFAIQVGITHLFKEAGITPSAVTGHSVGEVAAAWASGALTLQQAVEVIFHRSHFQGKTAGQGEMTAVAMPKAQVEAIIAELNLQHLSIAGVNSAQGITLAGKVDDLNTVERHLRKEGVRFKRLPLNYAFHSPIMDSIESGVKSALSSLKPQADQLARFFSTVTGDHLSGNRLNAEYWWKNIREPVLFHHVIKELTKEHQVFVEIGAHPVLSGYLKEVFKEQDQTAALTISTLSRDSANLNTVKKACVGLWSSGTHLDWRHYFPVDGQPFNLPAYPWQKEHFWTPKTAESSSLLNAVQIHPLLGKALLNIENAWENRIDTQLYPWLAEHQIGEAVLFPGAGFVELALAAAYASENRHVLDIEEIEIRSPLILSEAPAKKVRTRFTSDFGHLSIESREFNTHESPTLHVKCRVLSETVGLDLLEMAPDYPNRPADFDRVSLNQAAKSADLFYGETFQCIAEGWIAGNTIIGRVEPQGHAKHDAQGYCLHPGILDSALQLVMALLYLKGNTDVVYVPIQIGRIQWQYTDDPVTQVVVTLKRQLPHSLLMDVRLFDPHGNTIALLSDVRMRAAVLRQKANGRLDQWVGCLTPMPLPSMEAVAINLDRCQHSIENALESSASYQSYVLEVEPLLDTYAEQLMSSVDESNNAQVLLKQKIQKHFNLSQSQPLDIDLNEVWFALLHDYPGHFALVQQLQLPHSSHEQGEHKQIDLQQQYTHLLRMMLSESAHHAIANSLSKFIQDLTETLDVGERVSFAEISALDPWWAPWIFDTVNSHRLDYHCILANDQTQNMSSALRSKYPDLNSFSLDEWLKDSDSSASRIDFAIVTLDFADLTQAKEVLQKLQQCLKSKGEAILLLHHPVMWLDLALGSHDAWWISENQSQQASRSQWCELLDRLGFVLKNSEFEAVLNTGLYTLCIQQADEMPQELTQSTKIASKSKGPLLLLSPKTAPQLDREYHYLEDLDALEEQLAQFNGAESYDIVWMTGTEKTTPELKCQYIHHLAKRLLEFSHLDLTVYCVTHAVSSLFECDRPAQQGQAEGSLPYLSDDVAVWGFVRTLMNELSHIDWRLVDLPRLDATSFELLQNELAVDDNETEVVYNAQGKRFAVRFKPAERVDERPLKEHQTLSLGFQLPGQLRNLEWQASALRALEQDEVLIDVKSTGLNFRDVMYALGLLSDEAIEDGYSGPTLGLEFAGEVIAVGDSQRVDFKIGDAVVGFGPASFSTRVIAKVSALAHLPEGVSFEAAATIPTTFFTAWYALNHCAQLQKNERILIHGAAGGVGIAAIQIAQLMGAEIYATAGSEEKRHFLAMLGVEHIFDSRSNVFAEQILSMTPDGQGVDVVLNSLAGEAIAQNLRVLKPFGRFLELGKRDFYENTPMGLRPFRNNLSYFGIDSDQLMNVKPSLTSKLFNEVMEKFRSGDLYPLPYTLFTAERVEEAFRYMQQAKQIGKVVVTYPRPPKLKAKPFKPKGRLQLKEKGIYLVTGGLSGFGFRTAQWLVEKGARALLLISRSGKPSDEIATQIAKLQQQGIRVQTAACDITEESALHDCIQQATHEEPIIGVVHAAAVYQDALAQDLTDEQVKNVMQVKTQGAIHLDKLTENLDLFVVFSSATTLFGNPGQSHYVAANYWLEAFASWRRQQGKVATCVNWGPINDVGYLARETQVKEKLNQQLGSRALNAEDALASLEHLILEQRSGIHTLYLDWSSLSRFLPSATHPKYQKLNRLNQDKGQGGDHHDLLVSLIEQGDIQAAESLLIAMLTTELSQILLLPEDKIEASQPIYDLGFDSLMAAELMAAIDSRIGVKLPVMALNDRLTLSKLAQLILEKLNPHTEQLADQDEEVAQLKEKHGVDQ